MKRPFEYRLIIAALFFGLFYRVMRSVVYDSYFWIMIVPAISIYYMYSNDRTRIRTNSLDNVFYYYMAIGFLMTVVGLFIASDKVSIVQIFFHIYAPAAIYFVAKIYFSESTNSLGSYFSIALTMALLLVVDILIEYYYFMVPGVPDQIPWIADGMQQSSAWGATIWDSEKGLHDSPTRFLSILASGKSAGLLVAGLFCMILPLALEKSNHLRHSVILSIFSHKYLILILLIGLLRVSFLLPSLANTLSLGLVSLILIFKTSRKIYSLYALILGLGFIYYAYWDSIQTLAFQRTNVINSYGKSAVDFIFQVKPLQEYYTNTNIMAYIFSSSILPSYAPRSSLTELDLFLLPVKYGMGWTIIVISGGYYLLKYSQRLIGQSYIAGKIFGLSSLGYFLVIFTNIHYPKFHIHGNYELFMIVAGALSAFYDKLYHNRGNGHL